MPRIVLAYLVPFAFGWLLHANSDLLGTLARRAWTNMALSAGLFGGYMLAVAPRERALGEAAHLVRAGAAVRRAAGQGHSVTSPHQLRPPPESAPSSTRLPAAGPRGILRG